VKTGFPNRTETGCRKRISLNTMQVKKATAIKVAGKINLVIPFSKIML
jgi:hypothetical protein